MAAMLAIKVENWNQLNISQQETGEINNRTSFFYLLTWKDILES